MRPRSAIDRRTFLRALGTAGLAVHAVARDLIAVPPGRTLRHASFGSANMAWRDIQAICSNDFVKLVAVAEVDLDRAKEVRAWFPEARIYQDWRELLAKEHRNIDSINIGTPDHMHAPMAMTAMRLGKHVYCQKPLTHDIYEARQLARFARAKRLVTQMGIQVHSQKGYRQTVALLQSGAIGKIKEAHLWSFVKEGDLGAPPVSNDPVPSGFDWDLWQGVGAARPYVGNDYYHPANWRRRLDFGTGSLGDWSCHIYDPVFEALELTAPITIRSEGPAPDQWNWAINSHIRSVFPGTRFTDGKTVAITWYDGDRRPPASVQALVADGPSPETNRGPDAGSIIIGTEGTLRVMHTGLPKLFPVAKYKDFPLPQVEAAHHWTEWAEACLGHGTPSANFDYSGPLTETVLLGCIAVRFPKTTLEWNSAEMRITNVEEANRFVRRRYRAGWETEGL